MGHIYGLRFDEYDFPLHTAVRDVVVFLPPMNAVQCIREEGSRLQVRNMLSSLRNWNLAGRIGHLRIELYIFDFPLAIQDWVALSTTFTKLRAFRRHVLNVFVNGQPRWTRREGYWLDWVLQGHVPSYKGDILFILDLFM